MQMLLVLCAALALSVDIATAAADGGHGKGGSHGKAGVHGNAGGVHGNSDGVHGNSDAAKDCQKGGYGNWQGEDGAAFMNTGDCVSYAAKGGTLQPVQLDPVSVTINLSVYFSYRTADTQYAQVTGTGFLPNTKITFTASGPALSANALNASPYVFTDPNGAFDSGTSLSGTTLALNCDNTGSILQVTASDGTHTATTDFTVPACSP